MTCRPMWYSSSRVSAEEAGLPMSGKSLAFCASAVSGASASSSAVSRNTRSDFGPCRMAGLDYASAALVRAQTGSERIRGEIRESRAFAADERDVPRVGPAAEAIDDVGQTGSGLGEVGRI